MEETNSQELRGKIVQIKLDRAMEELDFVDRDVHQHICRVYLTGSNNSKQPWKLPSSPPAELSHKIVKEKYEEFSHVSIYLILNGDRI